MKAINQITLEHSESQKYYLKPDRKKPWLVALTRDNVARAEAMFASDSSYARGLNSKNGPKLRNSGKHDYIGASAYWMTLLKMALADSAVKKGSKITYGTDFGGFIYAEILAGAIASVDNENSTHLNANGIGRMEIWNRLLKFEPEEIKTSLKKGDLRVFNKLAQTINIKDTNGRIQANIKAKSRFSRHPWLQNAIMASEKDTKYYNRDNISFASKFCHYVCFYVFEGTASQDNYSIWDNVVKDVLPNYLAGYDLDANVNLDDYATYRESINSILEAISKKNGRTISRNGFDHLLWYYHKGR